MFATNLLTALARELGASGSYPAMTEFGRERMDHDMQETLPVLKHGGVFQKHVRFQPDADNLKRQRLETEDVDDSHADRVLKQVAKLFLKRHEKRKKG